MLSLSCLVEGQTQPENCDLSPACFSVNSEAKIMKILEQRGASLNQEKSYEIYAIFTVGIWSDRRLPILVLNQLDSDAP